MIDVIFAIKFVHELSAAVIGGAWFGLALFMLLAHRSGNTAVVALTAQFVVSAEKMLVAPALVLQAVSGLPLAWAIGLSPFAEFWIDVSLVLFAAMLLCWLGALWSEIQIRDLSRQAALNAVPLPAAYRSLFRRWSRFAVPLLIGVVAIYALMIWQPRPDFFG
jgi:uncharacterized membrane protein